MLMLDCFCRLQVSYLGAETVRVRRRTRVRGGLQTVFSLLWTGRYAELQVEFSSAVRTSAEQKALILKLEHDLSTVQAMSSLPRPDVEGSEVSDMGNIPEPIKEATAMFAGTSLETELIDTLAGGLRGIMSHRHPPCSASYFVCPDVSLEKKPGGRKKHFLLWLCNYCVLPLCRLIFP